MLAAGPGGEDIFLLAPDEGAETGHARQVTQTPALAFRIPAMSAGMTLMSELFIILVATVSGEQLRARTLSRACARSWGSAEKPGGCGRNVAGHCLCPDPVVSHAPTCCTSTCWSRWSCEYLRTITFILVIAASVQFTEIMVRRLSPLLDQVLGIYIPADCDQLRRTRRGAPQRAAVRQVSFNPCSTAWVLQAASRSCSSCLPRSANASRPPTSLRRSVAPQSR